jgi:hypothetical protein
MLPYVCVVNALIKGRMRACVVRVPVDGCFLVWWVIDNIVWIDSWLSITGVGWSLVGVSAGEEQARKVYTGGPPGVEQTSRLGSRDSIADGVKCGPHGGKNNKRSRGQFLGWVSKPRSSRDDVGGKSWVEIGGGVTPSPPVSNGSPQNHWVPLLIHKTKTVDWSVHDYSTRPVWPVGTGLTGEVPRSDWCAPWQLLESSKHGHTSGLQGLRQG